MSASSNFLVGVYNDDEIILDAVKVLRAKGVKIFEVYSPFPVHGIDPALGYKRSRLSVVAFIFGICGTFIAGSLQSLTLGLDWPMIIGGKPHVAPPAFVPVTFELTVLMAALGMVFTFLVASGLGPGSKKPVFDPRATDDKFVMAVDLDANKLTAEEIASLMKETGAEEVSQKELTA